MRSYVNQSTYVMYIHIRPEDLDNEVALLLERPTDPEALRSAWSKQFAASHRLFFHEIYHYWQGLRLPFLYRYAVLSHRYIMEAYAEMAKQNKPLHEWNCGLPGLYRLTLPVRIWSVDDTGSTQFVISHSDAEPPEKSSIWWDLTPQDLLETAASVSEFQVTQTHGEGTDPEAFRRWCKRYPAYSDAFEIVSKVLGESLALAAVVSLVNGAFHTSDPCRSFTELLARMRVFLNTEVGNQFLSYPEPRQWSSVVNFMLDGLLFESDKEDGQLLGSPYHRIDLTKWLSRTFDGELMEHPFLTKKAIEWQRRIKVEPGYSFLLAQPAWVGEKVFWEAFRELMPPLSFVKFYGDMGHQPVIATGDTDLPQADLERYLTIYSVVHRASEVGFDPKNHLCHHVKCPQYGPNYCNTYPVPREFTNCGFPRRHDEASSMIGRKGERS